MADDRTKHLRKFGLTVGGVLTVIGGISFWRGHELPPMVLWTIGGLLLGFGLVWPRALGPVERGWMRFAGGLAYVNTRIILTLVFYLLVFPVGTLRRLFGGDPLERKLGEGKPSNWVKKTETTVDPARYRMQY